jgi:hypothetical protein
MPIYAPPIGTFQRPTVGVYRAIGRNDEALTSVAYGAPLLRSLEQIYRSSYWRTKTLFAEARRHLNSAADLAPGWDGDGSEPPNTTARALAAKILDLLEGAPLSPARLTPTVEGGIALSFVEGTSRAVIEVYNTGEIAAATYSDHGEPTVWEPGPTEPLLQESIEQIRVHLAG